VLNFYKRFLSDMTFTEPTSSPAAALAQRLFLAAGVAPVSANLYDTSIHEALKPGLLLSLLDEQRQPIGSAVVLKTGYQGQIYLGTGTIQGLKFYTPKNWFSPKVSAFEVVRHSSLIPASEEESSFDAGTEVPADHPPGFISWELHHEDLLVVKGTDHLKPGVCYASLLNFKWPPGAYLIKARRYSKTLSPLSHDEREFSLEHPSNVLSVGTKDDMIEPLHLV
jgi:hypothetical protein